MLVSGVLILSEVQMASIISGVLRIITAYFGMRALSRAPHTRRTTENVSIYTYAVMMIICPSLRVLH